MRSLKTDRRKTPTLKRRRGPGKPSWVRLVSGRAMVLAGVFVVSASALALAAWQVRENGLIERAAISVEQGFEHASRATGLAVRDVLVEGRGRTGRADLLRAISIDAGDPILTIDIAAAQSRIAKLAWVKRVRVERRLPDTVFVSLIEREPLALWQRDGKLALIDRDGEVILNSGVDAFAGLPIVIGENAPARALEILAMLAGEPDLNQRVRAVTWVGDRRWDVRVDDRIKVQLPEQDPHAAWSQLAQMERDHGVLRRDVIAVDMRLADQLVVRVAPGAAARKQDKGRDT